MLNGKRSLLFLAVPALALAWLPVLAAQQPETPTGDLTLSGVPVGGKSPAQVKAVAQELSARLLATPLALKLGARHEITTAGKLGATLDLEGALAALADPTPRDVPLPVLLTEDGVSRGLERLLAGLDDKPRDGRLTMVAGKFKRTPGRPGRTLDAAQTAQAVQAALDQPAYRRKLAAGIAEQPDRTVWLAARGTIPVEVATRDTEPRIGEPQLAEITTRLVNFSTSLAGSSANRIHNIGIACRNIDGMVLLPGDVFSYNQVVGRRVRSAGYRNAPVIVNGEMEQGLAGGICQVSSTLYNAALLADLGIVSRRHHSHPVRYLPAGRDATVVDGVIDFKFKNTLDHPIALDVKVSGGRVVINVFGHPDDRRQVEIFRSGIARVGGGVRTVSDAALPRGRRVVVRSARSGSRVTVTRVVKKDGKLLRKEVVSRDYYPAVGGLVRVGTREAAKPVVAAPPTGPAGPPAPPVVE